MGISERARKVLSQIIQLHYQTCEPVGSGLIYKTRIIKASPATIRNIMVRLESSGFLRQPHTSAGRLPTDLGYRAYVDQISLERAPLESDERLHFEGRLAHLGENGPMLLKTIATHLHDKTKLATFYLPFRLSGIRLKHLHFERIDPERLLVLWISAGNQAYQTMLHIPEAELSRSLAQKVENYFNGVFTGYNLSEIRRMLYRSTSRRQDAWDLLLEKAALITKALAADAERYGDLQVQGLSKLMEMPEFQNTERLKTMVKMLEEPTQLTALVQRAMASSHDWIVFNIGGEMGDPDLNHLTLVLAKFRNRSDWLGCVGVVGPKRMPYLKSLQMLSFAKDQIALQLSE